MVSLFLISFFIIILSLILCSFIESYHRKMTKIGHRIPPPERIGLVECWLVDFWVEFESKES